MIIVLHIYGNVNVGVRPIADTIEPIEWIEHGLIDTVAQFCRQLVESNPQKCKSR